MHFAAAYAKITIMNPRSGKKRIKEFVEKRFGEKTTIGTKMYYIHAMVMVFFSAWVFGANLLVSPSVLRIVLVSIYASAFIAFGMYAFFSKYNYPILVISNLLLTIIVFPGIFFASSGFTGGALILFLFGVFLLTITVKRPLTHYLIVVLFVWYILCLLAAAYYPQLVLDWTVVSRTFNIIFTFFCVVAIMYVVLRMIVTGYNKEHRQLKILNHKLKMELITDDLTEIYNHRHIKNEIIRAVSQATESSHIYLCMYDLDDFKQVNDEHGHMVGNDILYDFAQMMKEELCEEGICSRYGGEEFMVLIEDKSPEVVFAIAERIRKRAEKELFVPNTTQNVTVSCGIARYKMGEDGETFAKAVDARMYKAKHRGKNQTVFY